MKFLTSTFTFTVASVRQKCSISLASATGQPSNPFHLVEHFPYLKHVRMYIRTSIHNYYSTCRYAHTYVHTYINTLVK